MWINDCGCSFCKRPPGGSVAETSFTPLPSESVQDIYLNTFVLWHIGVVPVIRLVYLDPDIQVTEQPRQIKPPSPASELILNVSCGCMQHKFTLIPFSYLHSGIRDPRSVPHGPQNKELFLPELGRNIATWGVGKCTESKNKQFQFTSRVASVHSLSSESLMWKGEWNMKGTKTAHHIPCPLTCYRPRLAPRWLLQIHTQFFIGWSFTLKCINITLRHL